MCGVDADTFKQIFRDHWGAFKTRYPTFDTPDYNTAVRKMLDCGDPEKMGYVQYRCLFCGETRRIAFTCKSCFCLSCAQPRMAQWADFIGRRLLPGVRSVISFIAGVSHMPIGRFLAYSTLGAIPWTIALVYAGTVLGSNWTEIRDTLRPFDTLILVACVVAVVAFVWWRLGHPGWRHAEQES